MTPINNRDAEEIRLERLKEILLREEREKIKDIQNKVADPAYLQEKITPIFEEQFYQLKQKFPEEYEAKVNQLIDEKLESSQEAIVNVIYPVLGKMIKKYVTLQIQSVKDVVDERIKNTFTVKTLFQRMKASVFGIKESDVIFSDLINYQVEEAFLIEKNSGLVVGTASRGTTMDKDVIAGMLTAIKAFGEDAFKKEAQEISSINYDSYKIILQSFHSYYLALVVSGSISSNQQNELGDKILDFGEAHLKEISSQDRDKYVGENSQKLHDKFIID